MKLSYNLGNAELSFDVKDEFSGKIQIEQQSVTLEFEGTELVDALNNSLEMRKCLQEGFIKIVPIVKDAIKELGLLFSEEVMKHEKASFQMSIEHESVSAAHAEADHQRRMKEIEAEKK